MYEEWKIWNRNEGLNLNFIISIFTLLRGANEELGHVYHICKDEIVFKSLDITPETAENEHSQTELLKKRQWITWGWGRGVRNLVKWTRKIMVTLKKNLKLNVCYARSQNKIGMGSASDQVTKEQGIWIQFAQSISLARCENIHQALDRLWHPSMRNLISGHSAVPDLESSSGLIVSLTW